jgi:DNA glycosylase AlkZ-like
LRAATSPWRTSARYTLERLSSGTTPARCSSQTIRDGPHPGCSRRSPTRVIPVRRSVPLPPGLGGTSGTVLVDGFWQATWKITREKGAALLRVEPFTRLAPGQAAAVAEEGARLLAFAAADAGARDVHVV